MQEQVPDTIAENIRKLADYTEGAHSVQDITQEVTSVYNSLSDNRPDDSRWTTAFRLTKKDLLDSSSQGGSSGRGDTASIIVLGHGRVSRWTDKNHDDYVEGMSKDDAPRKDVLIANGIVRNEETGRTDVASILLDSTDGVNLGLAMELFSEPFNVVSGRFNFTDPRTSSRGQVLFSNQDTALQEIDDPMPLDERRQLVDKYVDDVDVASLASDPKRHLSLTDSNGPADFGIDIKRISGATIYGHWIDDENDRGVYTILDDSVMGPEEVDGTAITNDKQRVPGLSAWSHSNLMDYDNDSIGDFYGVVKEDYNGQITMDVRGIDIEYANRLDGADEFGSQSAETF